jgi:hypothetical protein
MLLLSSLHLSNLHDFSEKSCTEQHPGFVNLSSKMAKGPEILAGFVLKKGFFRSYAGICAFFRRYGRLFRDEIAGSSKFTLISFRA